MSIYTLIAGLGVIAAVALIIVAFPFYLDRWKLYRRWKGGRWEYWTMSKIIGGGMWHRKMAANKNKRPPLADFNKPDKIEQY